MSEIETEETVIRTIDKSGEPDDLIRLSTGVVLRGLKANTGTLISIIAAFPRPRPPVWIHPQMGREMENPNDPDYIARVSSWQTEQGNAVITAFILLGTELVSKPSDMLGPYPVMKKSKVPDGVDGGGKKKFKEVEVISRDWIEEYELLNLPMRPENLKWRYLTWVKFKAAPEDTDLKLIQEVVGRLSGVSKKDVQAAEEFPGGKEEN